jgi:hypothetical protein
VLHVKQTQNESQCVFGRHTTVIHFAESVFTMWTNAPTARLGTKSISSVQGCLSLLMQPQIRKFVFGGLEMTASEFEDGAMQAAQTVYHHLESASSSSTTSTTTTTTTNSTSNDFTLPTDQSRELSDALAGLCEENLVGRLSSEVNALPAVKDDDISSFSSSRSTVSVESASFAHMRLVVGGGRQQASTWKQQSQTTSDDYEDDNAATSVVVIDPVAVGDGLVILARRGDFGEVPEWAQSLLGLRISDTYCRKLMHDHGLAVQCAVDVTCRMMTIGETSSAGDKREDDVAAPHQGTTSTATSGTRVTQQWLFESGTLDPEFSRPPQWRVVDINGSGGWGDFWSTPLEPAS